MAITYQNRLNVIPGDYPPVINLNQYDSDFTLEFTIYSSIGNLVLESGTTAAIRGTKMDGNGYSAAATINGYVVSVTGDEQMTAIAGDNVFELVLTRNGKNISTANFIIHVERAALDKDTIVSQSKIRELINVIDKTDDLLAAANSVESKLADIQAIKSQIETLKSDIQTIYDNTTSAASTAAADAASAAVEDVKSNIQTMVDTAVESAFPSINGTTMTGDHNGAYYGLVDAVQGKGLSTNDYTNADKATVTRLNDPDKSLSTNDYTNADKATVTRLNDPDKSLSTNDYTNEDKAVVTRLNDPSKGLSSNDFTNTDKQTLENLDVPNPSAIVALLDILKAKQILTNDTYDLIKDML